MIISAISSGINLLSVLIESLCNGLVTEKYVFAQCFPPLCEEERARLLVKTGLFSIRVKSSF